MKKHVVFFSSLLAFVFVIQGGAFLLSVPQSFEAGFRGAAVLSLFIALVHFFIAFGLVTLRKWAPHLGIFFQAYILLNFFISNRHSLTATTMLPAILTILSVSAFTTVTLFILRNEFHR